MTIFSEVVFRDITNIMVGSEYLSTFHKQNRTKKDREMLMPCIEWIRTDDDDDDKYIDDDESIHVTD